MGIATFIFEGNVHEYERNVMSIMELSSLEITKQQELVKMKRLASSLLLLVTLIYVVSVVFLDHYVWGGFISATAEAAMVGAIADWFAVTALFRHPLGLKIPHTAIIPNRKDIIAEQFGQFVQGNFLSESVISEKIRTMDLSRRVAGWLVVRENAQAVAEQTTAGLAGIVRVINDEDIQAMITSKVESRIRSTSWAPIISELLTFITSGRRQQEIIDGMVNFGLYLLEDSSEAIKERVGKETPWWFPDSVDKAIYEKIVMSVSKMLYEMQVDIFHPVRVRMVTMLDDLLTDLKHSPDIQEKEIALKEELLNQPVIRDFTSTLWADIKQALLDQTEEPDAELKRAIADSVISFGESILSDIELSNKIDEWAQDSARYLIRTYGHEVADLISGTIDNWDPESTSQRIEIQIGRDLQFIRINGTVIGALVGLVIHSSTVLPAMILP